MSAVKTEIEEINETRKKVRVTVAADDIASIHKQLIREFQREANIPGFRPGKATESVIQMRYGKELKSELSKRVTAKAYQEGVLNADFDLFGVVESNEGEILFGMDAMLEFTVDVFGEFDLPEYEGLKLAMPSTEPSGEEIDAVVTQIRNQRAEFKKAEKAVEVGDYVKCSYTGTIDGELIEEALPDVAPMWGTQKNTWEEAGTDHPYGVPAIIEELVGMSAGDSKEVTMDFPEDFRVEALRDKSAVYSLDVAEVHVKLLPEMDEIFYESLGVADESAMRERIASNLTQQKQQQNVSIEYQQISQQLTESVDFEIPESGVEVEKNAILVELIRKNVELGVPDEQFESNKETLHEEAAKMARERLKTRIILQKIVEKESIEASEEDFSSMIMIESQKSGKKPDKIVKELQSDQTRLARMRDEIVIQKAIDLIAEKAERQEVVLTEQAGDQSQEIEAKTVTEEVEEESS